MIDLTTSYMGLELKNPVVVSSCGLTKSLQGVQKCAEAGATVVQVCSTLYRNGHNQIGLMLDQIQGWMRSHDFQHLDDFSGRLSQARSKDPRDYERLQYIKALVGIE